MSSVSPDHRSPIAALFPGRETALHELLTPCVGHTFGLQLPQPDLSALAAPLVWWAPWPCAGAYAINASRMEEPRIDRLFGFDCIAARSLYSPAVNHPARDLARELRVPLASVLWDPWLMERAFQSYPDGGGRLIPEDFARLLAQSAPGSGLRLGDELCRSLLASLLGVAPEYQVKVLYDFRDSLFLACAYAGLGNPRAGVARRLLHECWFRGNYPFLVTDDRFLGLLCAGVAKQ